MISLLTWNTHRRMHSSLVSFLSDMLDRNEGVHPSRHRICQRGICRNDEEAKMIRDTWVLHGVHAAAEKAIFLRYFGHDVLLENMYGDKKRLTGRRRKEAKEEWNDFFKKKSGLR